MGKALVVSGGTDGLYTIKLQPDRARIDQEIAEINAWLAAIAERLVALEANVTTAQAGVDTVLAALDAMLDAASAAGEPPNPDEVRHITGALIEATRARDLARLKLGEEKAEQISLQARLKELQGVPLANAAENTIEAWCADYTEDISGEVGTIEVNGEGRSAVIIRPGDDLGAAATPAWTAARDGRMFYREGMSSAQAYFNAAILPGWQKFKPTYRVGTITAISGAGLCAITLDAASSSANALPINQSGTLTGVPVEYMSCDALVFAADDRVVIEFQGQNWENPKVIGFESNPKQCEWAVHQCEVINSAAWRCFWKMSADELFWWVEGGQEIYDGVNPDAVIIRVNGVRIPFYRLLAGGMDFRAFDGSSFSGPYVFFSNFPLTETTNQPSVYLQFDADASDTPDGEYILEAIIDTVDLSRTVSRKVVLNRSGWSAGTAHVQAPIDNTLPLYWGGFGGGVLYSDPLPLLIDTLTSTEYQNPNVALAGWSPAT